MAIYSWAEYPVMVGYTVIIVDIAFETLTLQQSVVTTCHVPPADAVYIITCRWGRKCHQGELYRFA